MPDAHEKDAMAVKPWRPLRSRGDYFLLVSLMVAEACGAFALCALAWCFMVLCVAADVVLWFAAVAVVAAKAAGAIRTLRAAAEQAAAIVKRERLVIFPTPEKGPDTFVFERAK